MDGWRVGEWVGGRQQESRTSTALLFGLAERRPDRPRDMKGITHTHDSDRRLQKNHLQTLSSSLFSFISCSIPPAFSPLLSSLPPLLSFSPSSKPTGLTEGPGRQSPNDHA